MMWSTASAKNSNNGNGNGNVEHDDAVVEEGIKLIPPPSSQSSSSHPHLVSRQSSLSLNTNNDSNTNDDHGGGPDNNDANNDEQKNDGDENLTTNTTNRSLLVQACVIFVCTMLAWHVPRYYITFLPVEHINRNIPYQKTTAGDVILDSELNQPLVNPPTVPCKFYF